jgi:hypothetical protein
VEAEGRAVSSYTEAMRLRDIHALYTVPARVEGEGADKRVLPLGPWSLYLDGKDPEDAFLEVWDENTDASALALICGSRFGVVALDCDTPDAEALVYKHKVPRTPAWRSTRGPHWLFRCTDKLTSSAISPGLDLLAESKLALIPPTIGREWFPSQSVDDVPLAPLPDWVRSSARRDRERVRVELGPELPPGEAHTRTLSIVGRLARVLPPDELATTATALNAGRLPEGELRAIVDNIAAKESPPTRAPLVTGVTLGDVHEVFDRGLFLPDKVAIDVAIAAVIANLVEIDPVFLLIVAAGSRGKTEVIDALRGIPEVSPLSTLTPATLLSGYRDPKNTAKDNSLLTRLKKEGKRVLLMKDFGTVLSMHREARSEILAQLREVFDGSFVRADGTGREITWEGHLGFIAGVTPAIDSHHAVIAVLGERFVYLRPQEPDRQTAARLSLSNVGRDATLREERREAVASLVAAIDTSSLPPLAESVTDRVISMADFATRARTGVERDGYGAREILSPPSAEAPMRLAKQLASIGRAALTIGYTQDDVGLLIERLAKDSVPPIRRACLDLLGDGEPHRTAAVAEAIDMPTKTTARALEDLAVLGLLDRTKRGDADNAANEWSLR